MSLSLEAFAAAVRDMRMWQQAVEITGGEKPITLQTAMAAEEKVDALLHAVNAQTKDGSGPEAELARLRAALEWFAELYPPSASPQYRVDADNRNRARAALLDLDPVRAVIAHWLHESRAAFDRFVDEGALAFCRARDWREWT